MYCSFSTTRFWTKIRSIFEYRPRNFATRHYLSLKTVKSVTSNLLSLITPRHHVPDVWCSLAAKEVADIHMLAWTLDSARTASSTHFRSCRHHRSARRGGWIHHFSPAVPYCLIVARTCCLVVASQRTRRRERSSLRPTAHQHTSQRCTSAHCDLAASQARPPCFFASGTATPKHWCQRRRRSRIRRKPSVQWLYSYPPLWRSLQSATSPTRRLHSWFPAP